MRSCSSVLESFIGIQRGVNPVREAAKGASVTGDSRSCSYKCKVPLHYAKILGTSPSLSESPRWIVYRIGSRRDRYISPLPFPISPVRQNRRFTGFGETRPRLVPRVCELRELPHRDRRIRAIQDSQVGRRTKRRPAASFGGRTRK